MRSILFFLFIIGSFCFSSFGAEESPSADLRQVRVAVYESEPFVNLSASGDFSGSDIEIISLIAEASGWELEFVPVEKFSNLLPLVASEEVDAAISSITITTDRERSVDFSHPYMNTGLGILIQNENDLTFQQSIEQWFGARVGLFVSLFIIGIVFVATLVFFGILFYIVDGKAKSDSNDEDGLTASEVRKGVGSSSWLAFTTGSTIGYGDVVPVTWAGRVLAIFCFFALAIVISNVTAEITSFRVVNQMTASIESANDLRGKDVAVVSGTTSVGAAYRYDAEITEYENIDQAIAALILGNVEAVVYDRPRLRHFANTEGKGSVKLVDTLFESQDYGIAFTQGSNLVEDANIMLLSLRENGELDKIEKRHFGQD